MSHEEKRFLRREWISYCLKIGMTCYKRIAWSVRFNERGQYGQELKAY